MTDGRTTDDRLPDGADSAGDEREAELRTIRRRAMDMLARREHAPAELAAKLRRRGHAADDIGPVLDALTGDGLLSAVRYAQAMVASRAGRGIGPERIRSELSAVAIDDATIEIALDDAGVEWSALARAVRVKRFGDTRPADFKEKARQMRFLQRRGFTMDQLQAAVDD